MNTLTARAAAAFVIVLMPAAAPAQSTTLESRSSGGVQQNGNAGLNNSGPTVSDDGRFIVFWSTATNLVANDTNGQSDIFLRDRVLGTTICVSRATTGNTGNGYSQTPSISADGRLIVFESGASDLIATDTNAVADVFLYDVLTGSTSRVNVSGSGAQADRGGNVPSISADGRYVVFESGATNLDPAKTSFFQDVFVRDLVAGTTSVVSTSTGGVTGNDHSQLPTMSDNGRWVAFQSRSTNFGFPDSGSWTDVFLKDRQTGVLTRCSSKAGGLECNSESIQPRICGDGNRLFFVSASTDLLVPDLNGFATDVMVYEVATGALSRASLSNTGAQSTVGSTLPSPSRDGRYCAFNTSSANLDPIYTSTGPIQIYVRDLLQGRCVIESLSPTFLGANASSIHSCLTRDGKNLVFTSLANNLDLTDTSSTLNDLFYRDRGEVRFVEYGTGLAGKGGQVPRLWGLDGRLVRGDFSLRITNGLGGTFGTLWISAAPADIFPVFGGHFYLNLGVAGLHVPVALGGASGVAGAGAVTYPGVNLSANDGTSVYLQALLFDTAAPHNISMSNGLEMHIGN